MLFRRVLTMGVVLVSIITATVHMYSNRLDRLAEARSRLEQYEEEYARILARQEFYRSEVVKLNNEDYVAKLARQRHFKSLPGEILFRISSDLSMPDSGEEYQD